MQLNYKIIIGPFSYFSEVFLLYFTAIRKVNCTLIFLWTQLSIHDEIPLLSSLLLTVVNTKVTEALNVLAMTIFSSVVLSLPFLFFLNLVLMFSELGGILHFFFRSGRGRKLSGDQITLPTTVDYSSVPKQVIVEVVGDLIP